MGIESLIPRSSVLSLPAIRPALKSTGFDWSGSISRSSDIPDTQKPNVDEGTPPSETSPLGFAGSDVSPSSIYIPLNANSKPREIEPLVAEGEEEAASKAVSLLFPQPSCDLESYPTDVSLPFPQPSCDAEPTITSDNSINIQELLDNLRKPPGMQYFGAPLASYSNFRLGASGHFIPGGTTGTSSFPSNQSLALAVGLGIVASAVTQKNMKVMRANANAVKNKVAGLGAWFTQAISGVKTAANVVSAKFAQLFNINSNQVAQQEVGSVARPADALPLLGRGRASSNVVLPAGVAAAPQIVPNAQVSLAARANWRRVVDAAVTRAKAETAERTANEAQTISNAARDRANAAQLTATGARTEANSARGVANEAQTLANRAIQETQNTNRVIDRQNEHLAAVDERLHVLDNERESLSERVNQRFQAVDQQMESGVLRMSDQYNSVSMSLDRMQKKQEQLFTIVKMVGVVTVVPALIYGAWRLAKLVARGLSRLFA